MNALLTADLNEIQQEYDVRLRQRGQITVPREVREGLNVHEGDSLSLIQFGSFALLTPKRLVVPELADRIAAMMEEEDISLADLLTGLEEERAAIYEERWRAPVETQ